MRPDVTFALSIGITLAVLCIGALRVIDVNEREPLWALALLLWLGVVAAAGAALVFDPQRTAILAALLAEGAKAAAIATGVATLALVGRRRGVSELNSVLDWLLYGAAAGAGFAIGDSFLRATFTAGAELLSPDPRNALELAWMTVQSCLTEAAFGAAFGAALGLAAAARRWPLRLAAVAGGLGLTVLARLAYTRVVLEEGVHVPGFSIPGAVAVAGILALALVGLAHALRGELGVIRRELADEPGDIVAPAERRLLSDPVRRYRAYLRLLVRGDVERWVRERRIHDHQVALAFAKRARGPDGGEARRRRYAIQRARMSGLLTVPLKGAPLAAAALVVAAGVLVLARASGGEAPSTYATRTSLAEREVRRLAEREHPPRELRNAILLVQADWRPGHGRRHEALLGAGAREAYELEYVSTEHGRVRYALARYGSAGAARDAARRLDAGPDAVAWADDEVVTQLRGRETARGGFCEALGMPDGCL